MLAGVGSAATEIGVLDLFGIFFLFFLLSQLCTDAIIRDAMLGLHNAGPLILTWSTASSIAFWRWFLHLFFTIFRALAPLLGHALLTGRVIAASTMRRSFPKRGFYSDLFLITWPRNHWVLVVLLLSALILEGMLGLMFSFMLNFVCCHSARSLFFLVFFELPSSLWWKWSARVETSLFSYSLKLYSLLSGTPVGLKSWGLQKWGSCQQIAPQCFQWDC